MATSVPKFDLWLGADDVAGLSESLGDPTSVAALRQTAFESFRELPLEPDPLYRKYGYFAGVDLTGIDPGTVGPAVPLPPAPAGVVRVVHDAAGTHVAIPPEVTAQGVRVSSLPEIWHAGEGPATEFLGGSDPKTDRLTALGAALVNRGYRLEIPERLSTPIRLQDVTVLSTPREALSVRRVMKVGASSRLLASEEVYSTSSSERQRLAASALDLDLGPDSQASFLTVHAPDTNAIGLYARRAEVGRAARLGWVWAGFGGYRTRARNLTVLSGQGSDVEDLQAFFGAGQQAYDSAIQITHRGTDTHGQSITRGVFQDEARGMSRGLVRIEKEARKTVSYLSEHAMLLSRGARSDTIPILEILCRDVKATHSTSVAPVDPEKVFYLESRGLERGDAVRMISEGFLGHVLGRAPIAHLKDLLQPLLAARWSGSSVDWSPARYPSLPRLDFAADVPETDWRFDAKLR